MHDDKKDVAAGPASAREIVTLCAWSNTVKYEGQWMSFAAYLERRFGLMASHGMSPQARRRLEDDGCIPQAGSLKDPRRLRALRATGLLDAAPTEGFDRITRLGAAAMQVPATFISLVDEHRDFYLSLCGVAGPLASERQLTGATFCHFTVQSERPVVIPDTRADPVYASVPTVKSLGIAAYLGAPLVLPTGEVIGAFCAVDFAPHAWVESHVQAALDCARLVESEIQLRQAALEFQRQLA